MKKLLKQFIWSIIATLLVISACSSPTASKKKKEPKFEIIAVAYGIKSYGSPYLTLTVENTGSATGYNVACTVLAKNGSLILDDGFAYFAGGADIDPGESAIDEAIFFDLGSHSDYTDLEYDLSWLDR